MRLWKGSHSVSGRSDFRLRACAGVIAGWLIMAVVAIAAAPSLATARVHASILVDAQTGQVLEAHNANRLCYPASLAKLMTLYITFQELSTGKMTLGEEMPVSYHAAAQPPTKLYLRPGERISVRSAILAITTRSANDAAVVLAEAIAGSEWKFAQLMNERARELGMNHTTFRNASGLPNRYQLTTARDMSKLALAILHNFPQYYHYFKATSFNFRGQIIYGHDYLLGRYPGVDGMKTGFTDASGFNIVTSAVRHGQRVVGVVMGGRTARSRDRLMISILNRGFARLQAGTLAAANNDKNVAHAPANYEETPEDRREDEDDARPDSGWIVQVGGTFHTPNQVRLALRSALHTVPRRLNEATPLVVKLRGRRYLARFSDMTEDTALGACRALRRRRFTCRAFQILPTGLALASRR